MKSLRSERESFDREKESLRKRKFVGGDRNGDVVGKEEEITQRVCGGMMSKCCS